MLCVALVQLLLKTKVNSENFCNHQEAMEFAFHWEHKPIGSNALISASPNILKVDVRGLYQLKMSQVICHLCGQEEQFGRNCPLSEQQNHKQYSQGQAGNTTRETKNVSHTF